MENKYKYDGLVGKRGERDGKERGEEWEREGRGVRKRGEIERGERGERWEEEGREVGKQGVRKINS